MKYLIKIYILIFATIISSLIYLYFSVYKTELKLNDSLKVLFIEQANEFSKNIEIEIKRYIKKDIYNVLKKDLTLRNHIEHAIEIMSTKTYKYIYVLYKDKDNNFRYLLDGSKDDKGIFNQKLNINKKAWNKVYKDKKSNILYQKDLENLWVTILRPVVFNDKVEAVIAIDFSTQLPQSIANTINPLNKIFFYIFIAIGIMLLILLYQTILNYRIKKDSITDQLTLAYNRHYLRDFLKSVDIANYQILMLDIDHFKKLNDSYGHKAGDYVLSETAKLIKNEIRDEDVFIRFGGEEFLIFIYRKNSELFLAKDIAERLRLKIASHTFRYNESIMETTVSIGITCSPNHFKSISDAIKHSDEMLYIAKRDGRNRVITSSDEKNNFSTSKSINDVKEALEEDRIVCYYQPIYNFKENKILKYEALVRMIDKDGSIILPMHFLANIMYTNAYNKMTKKVLDIVFLKISEIKTTISINLNFSDILDDKIYNMIIDELNINKNISPWLVIELLEYEINEQVSIINERLKHIKSYGVKIAIDDFGSGYSNYMIFESLPIDILKIDGAFIKNIDNSEVSKKITESIVQLSNKLSIKTVAEFIHSESVLNVVKSLNIDEGQGFHLGKPQANTL